MRSFDGVDRARIVIALMCTLGLLVAVVLARNSDIRSQPMSINGDTLGRDTSETQAEYLQRASKSLVEAEEKAFALVIFNHAITPSVAGRILETISLERVDAALPVATTAIALPEPTVGTSRADVLATQLAMVNAPEFIEAVIVYDTGDNLRELAVVPGVESIEVLPSNAVWGAFGIRQVIRDEIHSLNN
ncbi:putative secreted protein [Corynebacterium kutscheri]|uniref:Secreted protein n=1 Tax=Corynebacterium kutscheri TaxID=35755 RepID=A0A0F6R2B6_9CORY|nr:hypothetical protein [Corynebacterium kutscheri]AKE41543.1 hypothetical protein UL82_06890 [Corynebacterium kutscheri]VEH08822.1 putative secreted protein [Corynebacterium kutscheri]VEH09867.1 putative secreted protein [Corynebacterium kutscheri]VEH79951.1 putative secreted protein [Corynebacterium kutscheri]